MKEHADQSSLRKRFQNCSNLSSRPGRVRSAALQRRALHQLRIMDVIDAGDEPGLAAIARITEDFERYIDAALSYAGIVADRDDPARLSQ
jgi:hypothetical protein